MLARLGNVIYWIGCGVSVVALLFVAVNLVTLISPKETDKKAISEVQEESEILPQTKWRKIGEGEIMVEGVGIVEIEGDVPSLVEQQIILEYLREQQARQTEKKLNRERQESYLFLIIFSGIAIFSWLIGRGFRYVLSGK